MLKRVFDAMTRCKRRVVSVTGRDRVRQRILRLGVLLLLSACATNPVTGRDELMLIPESMELQIGQENYLPARQMQGGDYGADPETTAYVREVGNKLAAVSDRKLPYEFTVLNNPEVNAWAMPGGKLAINRGLLLKLDSEAELAAVLGHEIVHAAAKHGAKQMQQALMLQAAVVATSVIVEHETDSPITQAVATIGTQMAATLLSAKFSRDDERESDHYGITYMSRAGYDPRGAVSAQEMLLKESRGKSKNLFLRLLATHPPSEERVAANRALAVQLPPGGFTGRKEYHQRLSGLFKAAPAYAAQREATKAIEAGDWRKALWLADKAIRIEPREAQFHLLKGSVLEKFHQGNAALAEYRKAARMSPGYFEPHLRLGLLLDAMGKRYQARPALENSVRLLKTAPALYRLGRYALADGNTDLAREYLRDAAASHSPDGQAAYVELLRFDLPVHPGTYLDASLDRNQDGQLQIHVRNNTPFPVGQVVVEASDSSGHEQLNLNGVVQGNDQSTFDMGVTVTQQQIDNSSLRIVSARLAQ